MAKYVCSICGYVYDEQKEKEKFVDLPTDWKCPLCGAEKSLFDLANEEKQGKTKNTANKTFGKNDNDMLSSSEMNVLCTNLAKGCEKQYLEQEAKLFMQIADYYKLNNPNNQQNNIEEIIDLLSNENKQLYPTAFNEANFDQDRGALRVLTWSEKTTKILNSLLARYKKEGVSFFKNKEIFVCEICGFVYIGNEVPEICPICKVPKLKIHKVGGIL